MRFIFDNIVLFLVGGGSFIVGVLVSSQTLKDFFKGVPSEVRTTLKALEAKALAAKQASTAAANAAAVKAITPPIPAPPVAGAPAAPSGA